MPVIPSLNLFAQIVQCSTLLSLSSLYYNEVSWKGPLSCSICFLIPQIHQLLQSAFCPQHSMELAHFEILLTSTIKSIAMFHFRCYFTLYQLSILLKINPILNMLSSHNITFIFIFTFSSITRCGFVCCCFWPGTLNIAALEIHFSIFLSLLKTTQTKYIQKQMFDFLFYFQIYTSSIFSHLYILLRSSSKKSGNYEDISLDLTHQIKSVIKSCSL